MTTVDPVYTPTPISQRDGSALANSNCRMASIATGLDYDTRGAKRSTGAKMRTYCSDQSGGTDAGDAVQSWQNGYAETLVVRDGYTFDNALQDLRKGSAVHLDVWHASVGSQVCVSGSGAYGHTMFVLPDQHSDGRWKVADPWCSPAAWSWVDESRLRAGAEEWGRRVLGAATSEADWPTGGAGPLGWPSTARRDDVRWAILRRIVRELMELYHAGGAEDPSPAPAETSGPQPVLFTRTAALGVAEGGDDMALQLTMVEPFDGQATVRGSGHSWIRVADGYMGAAADGFGPKQVFARAKLAKAFDTPGASAAIPIGTPVVLIGDDLAVFIEADVELVASDAGGGDVDEAVAERDAEWTAWLLDGSPGSEA